MMIGKLITVDLNYIILKWGEVDPANQKPLMLKHMKDQDSLKRKFYKLKKLLISLILMEEVQLIPKVITLLCRTQSSYDFSWIWVKEPNNLSDDSRFGCWWFRSNRFRLVLGTDDSKSIRQRYPWKYQKDIQFIRWWEDWVHFNQKP